MIFETKKFHKMVFLTNKNHAMEIFFDHQKNHAIENHVMEIHVRRGLAVLQFLAGLPHSTLATTY